jgi:hypothetical protein
VTSSHHGGVLIGEIQRFGAFMGVADDTTSSLVANHLHQGVVCGLGLHNYLQDPRIACFQSILFSFYLEVAVA